jgi:hypothetical protein
MGYILYPALRFDRLEYACMQQKTSLAEVFCCICGGPDRIRTGDLLRDREAC